MIRFLTVYVAMLRGINVGSRKPVKMDKLRLLFDRMDLTSVRTYVNGGNVVFEASKASSSTLSKSITDTISREVGFPVPVVIRTSAELEKIVRDNPFLKEPGIDHSKLHLTLLSEKPSTIGLGKLAGLDAEVDRFVPIDREIYLYCPNGYGKTSLSNAVFERLLGIRTTTRNWKTIGTLAKMAGQKKQLADNSGIVHSKKMPHTGTYKKRSWKG